jgi:hypothetical protein
VAMANFTVLYQHLPSGQMETLKLLKQKTLITTVTLQAENETQDL